MPASGSNAGRVAAFLFDATLRRAGALKNIHQGGLTDMVIRRQKSDVNPVHLVKNLDHVDLGSRVSFLFERSFGDTENDDYGYDDTWVDDYEIDNDIDFCSRAGGLNSSSSYTRILALTFSQTFTKYLAK